MVVNYDDFLRSNHGTLSSNLTVTAAKQGQYLVTSSVTVTGANNAGIYTFVIDGKVNNSVTGNAQVTGGSKNSSNKPGLDDVGAQSISLVIKPASGGVISGQGITGNANDTQTLTPKDGKAAWIVVEYKASGAISVLGSSGTLTHTAV